MSCPAEFRALQAGSFARRVLARGRPATVIARFARSAYVANDAGIACIGDARLGAGPLNAIVGTLEAMPPPGSAICVQLAGAHEWQPKIAGRNADIARAFAALDEATGRGLFLVRKTHPAILRLQRWIAEGVRGRAPAGVRALVGMGPGLTPAGDDLIGGALIALHTLRRHAVAARLGAWALRHAENGTSRISRAHLACAVQGQGGEALHALLHAALSGRRNLASELAAIDAVGHTSGWDAAAGVALALQALRPPRR